MRVIELSDHPRDMLHQERRDRAADEEREQHRNQDALRRQRERVDRTRQARDEARTQRRWLAWLRGILAVRREPRQVPAAATPARLPSGREASLAAGARGEQLTAIELGHGLGNEWTLLRGYHNRRGEIDHLLLGPGGLLAIEGKYHNAVISCTGDQWWSTRYDKYGNRVGQPRAMTDRRDRSPSEQLNQPADELERFLRSRGHPVPIERIVLINHPRARLGNCVSPTVRVMTTSSQVITLATRARTALTADECAGLQLLIIGDHRHHARRRSAGNRHVPAVGRPGEQEGSA